MIDRMSTCTSILVGALLAGGCAGEVDLEAGTEGEALDPNNTFFTETLVELSPDGNHRVLSVTQVSLAQQIAMREAEERGESLRLNPTGCSFLANLRIYDNGLNPANDYTGNCLGLTGTGSAPLNTWCRWGFLGCSDYWGGSGTDDIYSFKTGGEDALFSCGPNFWCQDACTDYYSSGHEEDSPDHIDSTYVARHKQCSPG